MKLGFYDSGLGGLTILKEFVGEFDFKFSYYYFGDRARAPYGDKRENELKEIVVEICKIMKQQKIDVLISACNTSSMFLDQIDLSNYPFKIIDLFSVMKNYFSENRSQEIVALLATQANIDSGKFLEWQANIFPVKCPDIVPLVENFQWQEAQSSLKDYLDTLPIGVKKVILGCSHYPLLISGDHLKEDLSKKYDFEFINPAEILVKAFKQDFLIPKYCSEDHRLDLDFTKDELASSRFGYNFLSCKKIPKS